MNSLRLARTTLPKKVTLLPKDVAQTRDLLFSATYTGVIKQASFAIRETLILRNSVAAREDQHLQTALSAFTQHRSPTAPGMAISESYNNTITTSLPKTRLFTLRRNKEPPRSRGIQHDSYSKLHTSLCYPHIDEEAVQDCAHSA